MGLDAEVACRCARDGRLTSPPPVPIVFDRDYDGLAPALDHPAHWEQLREWIATSPCEHDRMVLADERVGAWAQLRAFQAALEDIGLEHFPVLAAQLPSANGGILPAALAPAALQELDLYRARAREALRIPVLIDDETGELVNRGLRAYGGTFLYSGSLDAGVDEDGWFFVRARETRAVLFASRRFEQRVRLEPGTRRAAWVELRCLDSGVIYDGGPAVSTGIGQRMTYPVRLRTGFRAEEHDELVGALERLLRAAVETGNPVEWY